MTEDDHALAELELERARIALDTRRLEAEILHNQRQHDLAMERFHRDADRPWYTASLPWLGPTLGALVAVGTLFLNQQFERASREEAAQLEADNRRFERESRIILQATDGVTGAQAVDNLAFYLEAGMIQDPSGRIRALVDAAEAPVTNRTNTETETCDVQPAPAPARLAITDHRLTDVLFCATPNVTDSDLEGGKARYVVVDFTATGDLGRTASWLANPTAKASAHVLIDRDGTVVQMVPLNRIAWHAGRSSWKEVTGLNRHSIGIELINLGKLTRSPEGAWLTWTGEPVPDPASRPGPDDTRWHDYPEPQVQALISVLRAVSATYGIPPEDIIGQSDISPQRKLGPGPAFPWEQVRAALRTP